MKELLERIMADVAKTSSKEIKLELTGPISKQLDKDLKEFGETTPASIVVCLITQLERESQVKETLAEFGQVIGRVLPPDELVQFKAWQANNIKLLRAAIKTCVDMIGE